MKKLVYSALALTLTGVPALATDIGWSGLDKEIESLSSSLQSANPSAPTVGGWVLTSYRHSSDIDVGGNDQSGFQFDSVRLEVEGDAGSDYSYKVSFDLSTGNGSEHGESPNGAAGLRDAWVKWRIYEGISGKIGRYKEQMLRSGLVSDSQLVLLDRTFLGELLDRRDLAVQVGGNFDVVNWAIQMMDGTDGQGDEHRFVARITANVVGKAGDTKNEGAYGAGDETNVMVGLAYQDDTNIEDGQIIAAEAALTAGPLSVAAELVDFDEGDAVGGFGLALLSDVADTTPWDITVSFLITPEYEVAGRWEDLDDDDDSTSWTIGVNKYVRGHDIKWGAQWKAIKTDGATGDIDQLGIGVGVSF